ncbi:acyltransferase [Kaistia algarum]|nr:acyltransferase [Kaistia algarum]
MVAIFHFNAYSHFRLLGVVANAYLFVDFFFVLSGFVIAANYARDLREGFGVGRFMLLRMGRLYPLHVAMLLVLVVLECLPLLLRGLAGHDAAPFSTADRGLGSLAANLFMIQGLGFERSLTWNFPSWSISAELATYLLFAFVATALPAGRLVRLLVVVAFTCPLLLGWISPRNMDATYDFGLIRAMGGFSAGVLGYALYSGIDLQAWAARLSRPLWTFIEIATVFAIVAFVSIAGITPLSLAGSLVFLVGVLVFAVEGGAVSAGLRSRPALRVGVLSYSIYMVHVPVLHVLMMAVHTLERRTGIDLTTPGFRDGHPALFVGRERWQGDLLTLGVLAVVLVASSVTYAWIETPGRRWTRRIVDRHLPGKLKGRFEARDALPS